MRRRTLMVAILVLVAGGLGLARPVPAAASTTSSFTTDITVGAGLTNRAWGFTDGCETGVSGSTEFRCAFEFGISGIPSTAQVSAATLTVTRTSTTGCGASDCPVDVSGYSGNGNADLGDVTQGSLVRIFNPTSGPQALEVSQFVQARVTAGTSWIGFRMARDSSSPHNPDLQDYSIFGPDRVTLSVTYVAQPVDVQVFLTANEEGAGGSVSSSPAGISCGETCVATFEYAEPVTLTAEPIPGALFAFWTGGPCDGSHDPVCQFIVPSLPPSTTAVFTALGPPISQPPGATPTPVPTQLTPPPLPTTGPSSGPRPTGGPAPTAAPAPTDVIASDGTVITPPPPTLAPGATPAPTIVGLGDQGEAAASGGVPLPVLIVLILILGVVVGGVVYWFTKRQQAGTP